MLKELIKLRQENKELRARLNALDTCCWGVSYGCAECIHGLLSPDGRVDATVCDIKLKAKCNNFERKSQAQSFNKTGNQR